MAQAAESHIAKGLAQFDSLFPFHWLPIPWTLAAVLNITRLVLDDIKALFSFTATTGDENISCSCPASIIRTLKSCL